MSDASDEVRAAAERMVTAATDTVRRGVFMTQCLSDGFRLGVAYLADHPADDAEPVTVANVGVPDNGDGSYTLATVTNRDRGASLLSVVWYRPGNARLGASVLAIWSHSVGIVWEIANPTRGDVRALLRGLKVQVREGGAG